MLSGRQRVCVECVVFRADNVEGRPKWKLDVRTEIAAVSDPAIDVIWSSWDVVDKLEFEDEGPVRLFKWGNMFPWRIIELDWDESGDLGETLAKVEQ